MFWSIISDYDLKTGLCELVDNALDIWLRNERTGKPLIEVELDANRQLISVADNLGGVEHRDLKFLVAPGGSKNEPTAERIGIFGVGSKRAGVALGEHVEIRTRYQNGRSFELDITKEWLESDDWEIAAYEIPDVAPGTTRIDISHLRRPFAKTDIGDLRAHLAETYSWFLENGCTIDCLGDFRKLGIPPGFFTTICGL
jgi:hypothetical protein